MALNHVQMNNTEIKEFLQEEYWCMNSLRVSPSPTITRFAYFLVNRDLGAPMSDRRRAALPCKSAARWPYAGDEPCQRACALQFMPRLRAVFK